MSVLPKIEHPTLRILRAEAACQQFRPRGTVRCIGKPAFRTQIARDVGCLLDVDHQVSEWSCLPLVLTAGDDSHAPDFVVRRGDRQVLVDAFTASWPRPDGWIEAAAIRRGYSYELWSEEQIRAGYRLVNSRDLLRYATWECPLGDRVRLLAALDEAGSLTVAECLPAFLETRPVAGLASLILQRFVDVELDDAPKGMPRLGRRHLALRATGGARARCYHCTKRQALDGGQ